MPFEEVPKFIKSAQAAILPFPDHQPDSLARGIKTVMEKEPELAALGEIARKTAIERFIWERQAVKIKTYFQDLLKEDSVFIR